MRTKQREVAKKTWICNLIKGTYYKSEGWTPGYVEFDGDKYTRISVVATAVARFITEDGNYGSMTLDDGTETIRLKTFGPDVAKLRSVRVGSVVRCIGKVRSYNDETYIAPEVLRGLEDPNWILLHRAQLGEPRNVPKPSEVKPQVSEAEATQKLSEEGVSLQKKMLSAIRALDKGMGADIDEVIKETGLEEEEAKNVLFGLLKAGDIYEPKKGKLKVLD